MVPIDLFWLFRRYWECADSDQRSLRNLIKDLTDTKEAILWVARKRRRSFICVDALPYLWQTYCIFGKLLYKAFGVPSRGIFLYFGCLKIEDAPKSSTEIVRLEGLCKRVLRPSLFWDSSIYGTLVLHRMEFHSAPKSLRLLIHDPTMFATRPGETSTAGRRKSKDWSTEVDGTAAWMAGWSLGKYHLTPTQLVCWKGSL